MEVDLQTQQELALIRRDGFLRHRDCLRRCARRFAEYGQLWAALKSAFAEIEGREDHLALIDYCTNLGSLDDDIVPAEFREAYSAQPSDEERRRAYQDYIQAYKLVMRAPYDKHLQNRFWGTETDLSLDRRITQALYRIKIHKDTNLSVM